MKLNCLKVKVGYMALCMAPALLVASEDQNNQLPEFEFLSWTDCQKLIRSGERLRDGGACLFRTQKISPETWASDEQVQSELGVPEDKTLLEINTKAIRFFDLYSGGLPTVEEATEMSADACKEKLLEVCSRLQNHRFSRGILNGPTTLGLLQPCGCEQCRDFAEKIADNDADNFLAEICGLLHSASLQTGACVALGCCKFWALEYQLSHMIQQKQRELSSAEEYLHSLEGTAKRVGVQLQTPPPANKDLESLAKEFKSFENEVFKDATRWYGNILDLKQIVDQHIVDLVNLNNTCTILKQLNNEYSSQLDQAKSAYKKYMDLIEDVVPSDTNHPKGNSEKSLPEEELTE